MIVTNNEAMARAAKHLTTQAKSEPVEFVHDEIGYNYRLTNVLAALGCAQLERIEHHLQRKREIADRYASALAGHACVKLHEEASWARSALWMFTVRLRHPDGRALNRDAMEMLSARRIQTRPLWQPMHRSPAHADLPLAQCPVADSLYADCLSLPCSVGLRSEAQDRVIEELLSFLAGI
jgi:perosamine synthetase